MWKATRSHILFQKREVLYFSRRVPNDLLAHYSRPRVIISLRTKSRRAAQARAISLAARLDEGWLTLRRKTNDNPVRHFHTSNNSTSAAVLHDPSNAPLMSEAKDLYVRLKGVGRPIKIGLTGPTETEAF